MVTHHRHPQTVPSDQDFCVFLTSLLRCRRTKNLSGVELLNLFKSVEQDKLRNSPFPVS